MKWKKKTVHENGKVWNDHVSEDGNWRIGEGHDEPSREAGKPYVLLRRDWKLASGWRYVDAFPTVAKAKSWAEIEG